jgi:hypothetical protein
MFLHRGREPYWVVARHELQAQPDSRGCGANRRSRGPGSRTRGTALCGRPIALLPGSGNVKSQGGSYQALGSAQPARIGSAGQANALVRRSGIVHPGRVRADICSKVFTLHGSSFLNCCKLGTKALYELQARPM